MTQSELRDHFATIAMHAEANRISMPAASIASWAYEIADAMISERQKRIDAENMRGTA